jgi:glyoxylase-like metal-dependent hydrolase (beta-lactamase superfamily II)
MERLGKKPADIKLVLLTHRHLDHIGSAAAMKKATTATIASHPFEKPYVAGTLVISTPAAWSFSGRVSRRLLNLTSWTMKLFRLIKYRPVHVDEAADEDSVLEAVGLDGSIIWTPGHTKGSVSLFLNKSRVAIIGDLLRSRHGKLREPMFMESIPQTEASVERVLDLGPAVICVGHGKPLPASSVKLDKRKMKSAPKRREKEEDLEDLASGLF